jgi:hypothetical protein
MGSLNINALTLIMANVLLKTASISVMHASFDRSQVPISHQMKKPQQPAWYICKPKVSLSSK